MDKNLFMENISIFLWYSAALIGVMLVAELFFRLFKLHPEWTRKLAHVGSGLIALTYPKYIDNAWIIFALTLSFTVILYISKKKGWFRSIFSISRRSYGELFFVWSAWLLFLLYQYTGQVIFYYLPFSVVVFADPAAALVGTFLPVKKIMGLGGERKSYGGTLAFFIVTFALTYYLTGSVYFSLINAAVLSLVEVVSYTGLDNLTIPVAAVALLLIFNPF